MSLSDKNVGQRVAVEVAHDRSKSKPRFGCRVQINFRRDVLETNFPFVGIERIGFLCVMRRINVEESVAVIIENSQAHAGLC